MSGHLFLQVSSELVSTAQPDILVVDEAHTMLKNSEKKVFANLKDIRTKRRILLTGTPLQNNVTEYFQMVEFVRPGAVGVKSVAEFETEYR